MPPKAETPTGRIRCLVQSITLSSGPMSDTSTLWMPDIGKIPKLTPKSIMSNKASQKAGVEKPTNTNTVESLSNNEYCFVPVDSNKKFRDSIEECLKVECIPTTIGDNNLLGMDLVMNSNGIIAPNISSEEEIKTLKKTGLSVYVNKDNHNANGNNILVNDKGGIINPRISEQEKKKIEDTLGIELEYRKVSEYYTVGSSGLLNNKGVLLNFRANQEEVDEVGNILKVPGLRGTTNLGTPFVSMGAVANDNGYAVGRITTAYEMGRIEEALGFLEGE